MTIVSAHFCNVTNIVRQSEEINSIGFENLFIDRITGTRVCVCIYIKDVKNKFSFFFKQEKVTIILRHPVAIFSLVLRLFFALLILSFTVMSLFIFYTVAVTQEILS